MEAKKGSVIDRPAINLHLHLHGTIFGWATEAFVGIFVYPLILLGFGHSIAKIGQFKPYDILHLFMN